MESRQTSQQFVRSPDSHADDYNANRPSVRDSVGNLVSEMLLPNRTSEFHLALLKAGGVLLTDRVTVNGRSVGWFLLDTGANFSMIDRSAAAAAGIQPGERLMSLGDPQEPDGAYRIKALTVGDVSVRNHAIFVSSLPRTRNVTQVRLAGIIGGDLWGALPFTLDYMNSTLTFFNRRDFHAPTGARRDSLSMAHKPDPRHLFASANPFASQPCVHGTINDVWSLCLLDTGCTRSIVMTADFAQQHQDWLQMNRPLCGPDSFLSGGQYVPANVRHMELLGTPREDVRDAAAMVDGWTAMVGTSAPETSQTIGNAFLQDFRLTFDYAQASIWSEWKPNHDVLSGKGRARDRRVSDVDAFVVGSSES